MRVCARVRGHGTLYAHIMLHYVTRGCFATVAGSGRYKQVDKARRLALEAAIAFGKARRETHNVQRCAIVSSRASGAIFQQTGMTDDGDDCGGAAAGGIGAVADAGAGTGSDAHAKRKLATAVAATT